MIRLFYTSLIFIFLVSCTKHKGTANTTLSFASLGISTSAGLTTVWGRNRDNEDTFVEHYLQGDDTKELELSQGNWNFKVIRWDTFTNSADTIRCAIEDSEISQDSTVTINLSKPKCNLPEFISTHSSHFNSTTGQLQKASFTSCDTNGFSSQAGSDSDCLSSPGQTASFKIAISKKAINSTDHLPLSHQDSFQSACVEVTTPGQEVQTEFLLPTSSDPNFRWGIISYTGPGCTQSSKEFINPHQSLEGSLSGNSVSFPETTLFHLKHDFNRKLYLIKDLNTISGSDPNYLKVSSQGDLFYTTKYNEQTTLWFRATGTTNSTKLLQKDDDLELYVTDYNASNDEVYFFINNWEGEAKLELWKTDKTTAGTQLVKDLGPGWSNRSNDRDQRRGIKYFEMLGNKMVFSFSDNSTTFGNEPWVSDGTPNGTFILKDIEATGNQSSEPSHFIKIAGHVYFTARDSVSGRELWKTDGTPAGTSMVSDFCPGSCDGWSDGWDKFFKFNTGIIGVANDSTTGFELASFDGTNISIIQDRIAGSASPEINYMIVDANEVYYVSGSEINGTTINNYNGSTISEVHTISPQANAGGWNLTATPSKLVYSYSTNSNNSLISLNKDGTSPTTIATSDNNSWINFDRYHEDETILYSLSEGASQSWIAHNLLNSTEVAISSQSIDVWNSVKFDAKTLVPHHSPIHGKELFELSLTGPPSLYIDSNNTFTDNSFDWIPTNTNYYYDDPNSAHFYFSANTGHGNSVFIFNKVDETISELLQFNDNDFNEHPHFSVSSGKLAFIANEQLYQITMSTNVIKTTPIQNQWMKKIYWLNNKILFANDTSSDGTVLMEFDPTTDTFNQVSDFNTGAPDNVQIAGQHNNGHIIFSAHNGSSTDIYTYDGTNVTNPVGSSQLRVEVSDSKIVSIGTKTYFSVYSQASSSSELYSYDGSEVSLVADLNSTNSSYPHNFYEVQGNLFFYANNDTYGEELYMYDGSTASLVDDIAPGITSQNNAWSPIYREFLNGHFTTLWDGTSQAIYFHNGSTLSPLSPNLESDSFLGVFGNRMYFYAYDGTQDALWSSDGTSAIMHYPAQDFWPEASAIKAEEHTLVPCTTPGQGVELCIFK